MMPASECGMYKGFKCWQAASGISYNCPALGLFGYATLRQLHGAITRALAAR
jgi:hypothetical protein